MGEATLSIGSSNHSIFNSSAVPFLQVLSISLTITLSIENGTFIKDTGTFPLFLFILGTFISVPFLGLLFKESHKTVHLYLVGLELFLYVIFILLFFTEWFLLPLLVIPFALSLFKIDLKKGFAWPLKKILIFVGLSFLMYFLGSLLQFIIQPLNAPVTLVSLKEVFIFPGEQFPFLFYFGMNIYGSVLTITISPLTLLVFSVVSALVAENYEGFFTVLRGRGGSGLKSAIYGVTAALSCQCEACISLLPAMIFVIVTITMIPLILESILLLVLSSYFIRSYRRGVSIFVFRKLSGWYSAREIAFAAFLVSAITPLELFGLYLGWLHTPIFFFGISMMNTLSGYVLSKTASSYLHAHFNHILSIALIAAGSILSLAWYIPALTSYAFSSGIAFSIMAISSLLAGIFFGAAHSAMKNGYLVPEAVSLIYGIFIIIIFYISIDFRLNIWPEFSYSQTAIFEIVSWAVMLPLMWIFTQMALYSNHERALAGGPGI